MKIKLNKDNYKDYAKQFYDKAVKFDEYSKISLEDAEFFFVKGNGEFRDKVFFEGEYDYNELFVLFLSWLRSA